jgi:tryptophan 2,3-dioxygenase
MRIGIHLSPVSRTRVRGAMFVEEARKRATCLGARHAAALYRTTREIPVAWREFYLVFPETLWEVRDLGYYAVAFHWNRFSWQFDFVCLDGDWDPVFRVVHLVA